MLSQWHIAGEMFIVNASTSVYVAFYLRVTCKNVQPLILRVPGVHCFQVHANVLAIPLSLVITSLFSCICTLLLQEVLFEFLLGICRFSDCLAGN